jgi:hypothetical protein
LSLVGLSVISTPELPGGTSMPGSVQPHVNVMRLAGREHLPAPGVHDAPLAHA